MTTVANKEHVIGADKRRTNILCNTYDDSVVKVFRFGELYWGQAGMVGLTELLGLHVRGHNVSAEILRLLAHCKANNIPDEHVIGQLLVYDAVEQKKFLYQSPAARPGLVIDRGEIPIPFFSIGSGAEYAFPILASGGSVEDAISHATIYDEGTGGGIDMAHLQADLQGNVVQLGTQPANQPDQIAGDNVQKYMHDTGLMTEQGVFTEKSVSYTATKAINLAELAKVGILKNLSSV